MLGLGSGPALGVDADDGEEGVGDDGEHGGVRGGPSHAPRAAPETSETSERSDDRTVPTRARSPRVGSPRGRGRVGGARWRRRRVMCRRRRRTRWRGRRERRPNPRRSTARPWTRSPRPGASTPRRTSRRRGRGRGSRCEPRYPRGWSAYPRRTSWSRRPPRRRQIAPARRSRRSPWWRHPPRHPTVGSSAPAFREKGISVGIIDGLGSELGRARDVRVAAIPRGAVVRLLARPGCRRAVTRVSPPRSLPRRGSHPGGRDCHVVQHGPQQDEKARG